MSDFLRTPNRKPLTDISEDQKKDPENFCSVCRETDEGIKEAGLDGLKATECGHLICTACYNSLRDDRCPLCRASISTVSNNSHFIILEALEINSDAVMYIGTEWLHQT